MQKTFKYTEFSYADYTLFMNRWERDIYIMTLNIKFFRSIILVKNTGEVYVCTTRFDRRVYIRKRKRKEYYLFNRERQTFFTRRY